MGLTLARWVPQMRGRCSQGGKKEKRSKELLTKDEPACQIWMDPREGLITLLSLMEVTAGKEP